MPGSNNIQGTRVAIRAGLESARAGFHTLLDSLPENKRVEQSLNPGWTNGEIVAHMLFGFIILNALVPMVRVWGVLPRGASRPFAWMLNALTRPFNWINALGARWQGRLLPYRRIRGLINPVWDRLGKQVDSIRDDEWGRGMYYPTRWDSNFGEFMTLEKIFLYPVVHFNYHIKQIAR